jgi:hypothetical protein
MRAAGIRIYPPEREWFLRPDRVMVVGVKLGSGWII